MWKPPAPLPSPSASLKAADPGAGPKAHLEHREGGHLAKQEAEPHTSSMLEPWGPESGRPSAPPLTPPQPNRKPAQQHTYPGAHEAGPYTYRGRAPAAYTYDVSGPSTSAAASYSGASYGAMHPDMQYERLVTGYYMPSRGPSGGGMPDVEAGAAPLLGPSYAADGGYWQGFTGASTEVRNGFVRKVFGLVLLSLALTTAVAVVARAVPPVGGYIASHPWVLLCSVAVSFGTLLVLALNEGVRRRHPDNIIAYMVFTAAQSLLVAAATAAFGTPVLLLGFGITAAATAAITLFALQTKHDFTASAGILTTGLTVLLAWLVLSLVLPPSAGTQVAIATLGALIFSMFLVVDVQQLLGGRHAYGVDPDEYVFAALSLYLDVINLLLYVLQLLQRVMEKQDH